VRTAEQYEVSTDWHSLDLPYSNDFEHGATDVFHVEMKDIGMPSVLKIKLKNWLFMEDEWLCNTVEVIREGESVIFPVFSYVDTHFEVMEGSASLLKNETSQKRKDVRKEEIAKNKETFKWIPRSSPNCPRGLPRHVNADSYESLPRIFKRFTIRTKDQGEMRLKTKIVTIIGQVKAYFAPITEVDHYHGFADLLREKQHLDYLEGWETDEGQGWQLLNGPLPLAFEACYKLPPYFNVTDEDLSGLLRAGKSLEDEMKNKRVFISDLTDVYAASNGLVYTTLPNGEKAKCSPAVALLYINEQDQFVPIAIQLEPNDREYLFVSDTSHDWTLAKMFYRNSLTSYHEWIYHFLHTHSIMEPVSVSLFRSLPKAHPVYKLLRPHLRTVSAINTEGRNVLLPKDSKIAGGLAVDAISFVKEGYKTFTWNDARLPQVLKSKGLDIENIPNYWYARDAMSIWTLMEKYVTDVLKIYYKSDQDVRDDEEVCDWMFDLTHEGIGWEDGNFRGIPEKFESISELSDFCATTMFLNSVQHTAFNYGQFENYSFPPNSPAIMNLQSHRRGEANEAKILECLPTPMQTAQTVAMSYGLSQYSDADEFLGEFREKWFVDKETIACQNEFRAGLKDLQAAIEERNAGLKRKYNRLNPSRVPTGIAI